MRVTFYFAPMVNALMRRANFCVTYARREVDVRAVCASQYYLCAANVPGRCLANTWCLSNVPANRRLETRSQRVPRPWCCSDTSEICLEANISPCLSPANLFPARNNVCMLGVTSYEPTRAANFAFNQLDLADFTSIQPIKDRTSR